MAWEFTLLFVALVIATVAGILIGKRRYDVKETQGILNVDCSEPADGPYLYLELTVPIANVADHKRVVFDVNVIPNISQK